MWGNKDYIMWSNTDSIDGSLEKTFIKIFRKKHELREVSQQAVIYGAKPEEIIYQNWVRYLRDINGIEHSKNSSALSPLEWMNQKLNSGGFVGKRVVRDLVGAELGICGTGSCDFIVVDKDLVDKILFLVDLPKNNVD